MALLFGDTMVGPALLGLLFPLCLQRSQPDKTQTNSLKLSLFDSFGTNLCDTWGYSLGFQNPKKNRHGNVCCTSTKAGAGFAPDKRWRCMKNTFSPTQLWKMAFECVLHRIRKALFQIYRSDDGTSPAVSMTQPEIFCLLAVISPLQLDYVLNVFLFV